MNEDVNQVDCLQESSPTSVFEVIHQTWDAVFHHQMKHREESFEGEIKDANTKQCFIRFPNTH